MDTQSTLKLIKSFFESGKGIVLKAQQIIIDVDEISEYIYLIEEGVVSELSYDYKGNTTNNYFFKKHEIFPLTQLYRSQLNDVGYSAFRDSKVWRKSMKEFHNYLERTLDVYKILFLQISKSYSRKITTNYGSPEQRLIRLLLVLAERLGEKNGSHYEINMGMTIQELSDNIRLTRESTGKILHELEQAGAVIMGRQRILIDCNRLLLRRDN